MAAWHEEAGATFEPRTGADAAKAWNLAQLVDVGIDEPTALLVAEAGVGWHDVADLTKNGCPIDLALEILA